VPLPVRDLVPVSSSRTGVQWTNGRVEAPQERAQPQKMRESRAWTARRLLTTAGRRLGVVGRRGHAAAQVAETPPAGRSPRDRALPCPRRPTTLPFAPPCLRRRRAVHAPRLPHLLGLCAFCGASTAIVVHWTPVLLDDWYRGSRTGSGIPFNLQSTLPVRALQLLQLQPALARTSCSSPTGRVDQPAASRRRSRSCSRRHVRADLRRWPRRPPPDARRLFLFIPVLWMVMPIPASCGSTARSTAIISTRSPSSCSCRAVSPRARAPDADLRQPLAPLLAVWGVVADDQRAHRADRRRDARRDGLRAVAQAPAACARGDRRPGRAFCIAIRCSTCARQSLRYGGLATKEGPLDLMRERGLDGTFQSSSIIADAGQALYLSRSRAGARVPAPPRRAGRPCSIARASSRWSALFAGPA